MSAPKMRLLVVEDNPWDARVVSEAFLADPAIGEAVVVGDGPAALARLRQPGPRPDLVLLDLKLPGMDGFAVLAAMKDDPVLTRIPVVILTSSQAEGDALRAREGHADAFLRKPMDPDEYGPIVDAVVAFWTVLNSGQEGMP